MRREAVVLGLFNALGRRSGIYPNHVVHEPVGQGVNIVLVSYRCKEVFDRVPEFLCIGKPNCVVGNIPAVLMEGIVSDVGILVQTIEAPNPSRDRHGEIIRVGHIPQIKHLLQLHDGVRFCCVGQDYVNDTGQLLCRFNAIWRPEEPSSFEILLIVPNSIREAR